MAEDPQLPLIPEVETPKRGPEGRFANCPGPGRPKGTKDKRRMMFDRVASGYTIDIIRRFCELAVKRDDLIGIAAGKIILDRTWPRHKYSSEPIEIDGNGNGNLLQAIIGQVSAGQLSPDAAAIISRIAKDAANAEASAAPLLSDPNESDSRSKLLDKLTRAVEARRQAALEPDKPA